MTESLNENAWRKLFQKYEILKVIEQNKIFKISADQIKEFREPRLMAKFDHKNNLPKIFQDNKLSILPITRGEYVIGNFDCYHEFETANEKIFKFSLPNYIQSLDCENIFSETIALNVAFAAGIIADFTEDEEIISTVAGRMSSGTFDFDIINRKNNSSYNLKVQNSQIEIDAAYEGLKYLAIFEAKRELAEDFLIRQLYYPYRTWSEKIAKSVKTVFFVYSNGIYRLYEYKFENPQNYNSLKLVKQKNYSVEDTTINLEEIQKILREIEIKPEPQIPFPQANNFERVINLCELLNKNELTGEEITENYDFDARQTDYYTRAAMYLKLVQKLNSDKYSITDLGKKILKLSFKQRQLSYCKCILSHKVFADTLKKYFERGEIPSIKEIVQIMKNSNLYKIESENTYERRASTIRKWLNWIVNLVNE